MRSRLAAIARPFRLKNLSIPVDVCAVLDEPQTAGRHA
jgi:hypothetical protein